MSGTLTADNSSKNVGERRVCSVCVGEDYLSRKIDSTGSEVECFYCELNEKTISIDNLATEIYAVVSKFFYLSGPEHGRPITPVIRELAATSDDIAGDIRRLLESQDVERDPVLRGEFNSDACYIRRKSVGPGAFDWDWLDFERSLKTESRYFNPSAERTLNAVFEGISTHSLRKDRNVMVMAGPESSIPVLYRARVFQSRREFFEAIKRPDRNVGPPPPPLAVPGRMNAAGISVFYGATSPIVAIAEVRPPVGSRVLVARFDVIKPLTLLDLEALELIADPQGSRFDPNHVRELELAAFLRGLSDRITRPVMPHDEPREYLPTQAIADFLANLSDPCLDGIIYPSSQVPRRLPALRRAALLADGLGNASIGRNVVLFHKSARVEALVAECELEVRNDDLFGFPENIDSDAPVTEIGADVTYSVFEKSVGGELAEYSQEAVLKVSGLEVHCVNAVRVETSPTPVHRYPPGNSDADREEAQANTPPPV